MRSLDLLALAVLAAAAAPAAAQAPPPPPAVIASIDLTGPFATRSPWRFIASQGPATDDPIMGAYGAKAPGEIHLCLRKGASGPCDPALQTTLRTGQRDDYFAQPRYLNQAQILHAAAGAPLLLVQTASLHSGDGDQLVFTQVLAYRRGPDRFERVYAHRTGRNHSQATRFIERGPLKGDIVSAEPTADAPFGFWVTVTAPTPGRAFRQALRYRSATRYGDGNPLSVIDSEMPNIEQRLDLWRPGSPLPLPAGRCPAPRMVRGELWCG